MSVNHPKFEFGMVYKVGRLKRCTVRPVDGGDGVFEVAIRQNASNGFEGELRREFERVHRCRLTVTIDA